MKTIIRIVAFIRQDLCPEMKPPLNFFFSKLGLSCKTFFFFFFCIIVKIYLGL